MKLIRPGSVDVARAVTPGQRDAMFALMDRHLRQRPASPVRGGPGREALGHPGPRPGHGPAVRLLDADARSTSTVDGRPVKALFSGDTIIDRERWGDHALCHVWGRLALSLIDAHPGAELYWFLISQGYKTYRFLPVFFHEFYPRHDRPTPDRVKAVIDALARGRYPEAYDEGNGVIRATPLQCRLRAGLADVTPERLRDPHVRLLPGPQSRPCPRR